MALSEAEDLLDKIKGYEGEVTSSQEQLDKTESIVQDVEAFSGLFVNYTLLIIS